MVPHISMRIRPYAIHYLPFLTLVFLTQVSDAYNTKCLSKGKVTQTCYYHTTCCATASGGSFYFVCCKWATIKHNTYCRQQFSTQYCYGDNHYCCPSGSYYGDRFSTCCGSSQYVHGSAARNGLNTHEAVGIGLGVTLAIILFVIVPIACVCLKHPSKVYPIRY
ncbi:uncharacterized protein LOC135487285 [Lineus longissimus]|uniref:uncharacterized protein LOC135487285 n=1 Tax=Lineus longissimus TaxID=88925 RepID=UPI002B4F5F63